MNLMQSYGGKHMEDLKNFDRLYRLDPNSMVLAQRPELRRRLSARLIDLGLFYVMYTVAYLGLVLAFNFYLSSSTYLYYLLAIAENVGFALLYAVVEGVLLGGTGYTLGKWTMGVKVIDMENESGRLPWKKAFKRTFLFAVLSGLGIPIIGWIVMGRTQTRLVMGERAAWDLKCKTNVVMVEKHRAGMAIFICSLLLILALIFVCAAGVIPGVNLEVEKHRATSSDGNFGAWFFRMPKEESYQENLEGGAIYINVSLKNNLETTVYEEIQSPDYRPITEEDMATFFNNYMEDALTNMSENGAKVKLKNPARDITGKTSDGIQVPGKEFIVAGQDDTSYYDVWYRVYLLPGENLRVMTASYVYDIGKVLRDYDASRATEFLDTCFYK